MTYTSNIQPQNKPRVEDPKGLDRLRKIHNKYVKSVQDGNKVLAKGRIMLNKANGGCLLFTAPDKNEIIVLFLVGSRKVEFQQDLPYEKGIKKESIGGSISGTTLKSLKETFRNFTKNSMDEEYFTEVLKIVNENL